ncbi:unnamed protein product [Euphydryas editha]|uniref:Reverse transcriptase domain-containing protein n=1 Tax=Euphydryas editha TaxID=104508 RepID=A0AAU9URM2_EUPED|nr:unnamed protein product [Euphydryas editha]
MSMIKVDNDEVKFFILQLRDKCAVGWDGISSMVVKAAVHVLVPLLTHIFNLCLERGVFPLAFKKALVHPVFKNGDRSNINNYRPISVLTTLSKVFEKILNKRLVNYLTVNNILSNSQFGFRAGKSTEDAVVTLTGKIIQNFDQKIKTVGIFLDLSKAFDTVSIPKLINKLEQIGIRGIALDIFKSYLSDRQQSVVVEGFTSDSVYLNFGVPQGSVLGPTLFLIYVNDLCSLKIPNCDIISYADDTALIVSGSTWKDVKEHSESAISIVKKWLNRNLLTLNLNKTKLITFAPNRLSQAPSPFTVRVHDYDNLFDTCNCDVLECTSCIRYLGVMIDTSLSWKHHIESVSSRTRKLMYVFKSIRSIADPQFMRSVYYALAQSILSYCIIAWGNSPKNLMLRVERAQRAVLKVMLNKPILFSTSALYSIAKVLTVRQLFILQTILRKHSELPYDPNVNNNKRRSYNICQYKPCRTVVASRHYYYVCYVWNHTMNLTVPYKNWQASI